MSPDVMQTVSTSLSRCVSGRSSRRFPGGTILLVLCAMLSLVPVLGVAALPGNELGSAQGPLLSETLEAPRTENAGSADAAAAHSAAQSEAIPGFMVLSYPVYPGSTFEAVFPLPDSVQEASLHFTDAQGRVIYRTPAISQSFGGGRGPETRVPSDAGGVSDPGSGHQDGQSAVGAFSYFIQGIDSGLAPGDYLLRLKLTHRDGSIGDREFSLRIEERQFPSEEIALNSRLTGIRTDESPQRQEESRQLSELLYTRNNEARSILLSEERRQPLEMVHFTARYGDRRVYIYSDGSRAGSIHNGDDYRAAVGVPVSSPLAGRVVMARFRLVTGYTVVLEHLPGVYSLYYHLDGLAVEEGQTVLPGDVLGPAGMTGLATGSHLHWEIRIHGIAVDPQSFLEAVLLDRDRLNSILSQ